MKVGHNPVVAVLMIACGCLSLVLGLVAGTLASTGVGVLVTGMGVLYAINPMAVVHEREIELKNPLGMTLKRITYESRKALTVREGRLFVRSPDGSEQRTSVGGMMVKQADLDAVAGWITNG